MKNCILNKEYLEDLASEYLTLENWWRIDNSLRTYEVLRYATIQNIMEGFKEVFDLTSQKSEDKRTIYCILDGQTVGVGRAELPKSVIVALSRELTTGYTTSMLCTLRNKENRLKIETTKHDTLYAEAHVNFSLENGFYFAIPDDLSAQTYIESSKKLKTSNGSNLYDLLSSILKAYPCYEVLYLNLFRNKQDNFLYVTEIGSY